MLLVYRINLLPDPQTAVRIWREECHRLGIGDIYLVAVQSFGITTPRPYGFDAAVEFPPHNMNVDPIICAPCRSLIRSLQGTYTTINKPRKT